MRCGQVYEVLEALRGGETVIFDEASLAYLKEKGLVKLFSEDEHKAMTEEVEKLSEEQKELESRLRLKESCKNQIATLTEKMQRMGAMRKIFYLSEYHATQKQLEALTESLPVYTDRAAEKYKTVTFTKEIKDDLEQSVKTNLGYVKLTSKASILLNLCRLDQADKDLQYRMFEDFKHVKELLTPQTEPSGL